MLSSSFSYSFFVSLMADFSDDPEIRSNLVQTDCFPQIKRITALENSKVKLHTQIICPRVSIVRSIYYRFIFSSPSRPPYLLSFPSSFPLSFLPIIYLYLSSIHCIIYSICIDIISINLQYMHTHRTFTIASTLVKIETYAYAQMYIHIQLGDH